MYYKYHLPHPPRFLQFVFTVAAICNNVKGRLVSFIAGRLPDHLFLVMLSLPDETKIGWCIEVR